MVVVADARFVPRDGAGRLDATQELCVRECMQYVVDRLPGYLGQAGAHGTENRLGIGVWVVVNGLEYGDPRTGHPQISRTKLIGKLCNRRHISTMNAFLD